MTITHGAGERSVERQKLIDDLYNELYTYSGKRPSDIVDVFLAECHIGLMVTMMNGPTKPILFMHLNYRRGVSEALTQIQRKARSFARGDEAEYKQILCTIALKLFITATSTMVDYHVLWQIDKVSETTSA